MRAVAVVIIVIFGFSGYMLYRKVSLLSSDDFRSELLISSKGERVYINSVNWGVTGDYQLTTVTDNPEALKGSRDTTGCIYGLQPFCYSFRNDTLKLFLRPGANYRIPKKFTTVVTSSIVKSEEEYQALANLAVIEYGDYRSVPRHPKNSKTP